MLHFFILGTTIFAVYGWVDWRSSANGNEIVVDAARVAAIRATFERSWQRPPSEVELEGLVDSWIREEILYREGIALGFDLEDPVIRRRVAQKMAFVADGMAPEAPGEAELEAWFRNDVETYRLPRRDSFVQVYIDPLRHGDTLQSVLAGVRDGLEGGVDPIRLGDPTLLPRTMTASSPTEISRVMGQAFADALDVLQPERWEGPIQSGNGVHFVRITDRIEGRSPALDEVRAAVERDWLTEKSRAIEEAYLQSLRDRYTVRFDHAPQELFERTND